MQFDNMCRRQITRRSGRLLQLRRGAVKGAPAPPYIWIAIAVVVCLAAYQWYAEYREVNLAVEKKAREQAPGSLPQDSSKVPSKSEPTDSSTKSNKRAVVLEPSATASNKTASNKTTANTTGSTKPPSPAKKSTPLPDESEHAQNPNAGKYRVTHVADGDTLNLEGQHRVRLIGIDCPEIAHPEKNPPTKAQPWSNEALRFTEARLKNQTVRVEFDPDYDTEDHYGRWLCWVYYRDQRDGSEKLLNEELLRAGLAFAYDDRRKFHYSEAMYRRLKAAQREAQEARRGIYSK